MDVGQLLHFHRPVGWCSRCFVCPWRRCPTGIGCGLLREGHAFMLPITCDLCGKELQPQEDHRYVVKIEVFAAHDPRELTEADLDEDHMEAVSELLRDMEDNVADPDAVAPAFKKFRYDLCPE